MIDAYLAATRGIDCQTRANQTLRAHYTRAFEWLTERLHTWIGSDLDVAELRVLYTPLAQADTFTLATKRYVIYDQYLGQVMNRLNRLLFEDATIQETDTYLSKIFAVRCLAAGQPATALGYAMLYFGGQDHLTRSQGGPLSTIRLVFTGIQEVFVLAHELAHCVVKAGGDPILKALAWYVTSMRIEAQEVDSATRPAAEEVARDIVADQRAAYERRYGPVADEEEAERVDAEARASFSRLAPQVSSFEGQLRQALADPVLATECLCDGIAFSLCAEWAREHTDLSKVGALRAAFVGLHHVRLLRAIDLSVAHGADGELEGIAETQTRVTLARLICRIFLWLPKMGSVVDTERVGDDEWSEDLRLLGEGLRFENERYAAILNDEVIFGSYQHAVEPKLEALRRELNSSFSKNAEELWDDTLLFCDLKPSS